MMYKRYHRIFARM